MRERKTIAAAFGSLLLVLGCSLATAADPEGPPQTDLTPPRLSFIEGQASFWRPGAEDWAPAQVNTPLWPGDALYTDQRANLEIQAGPRAFVRLAERTRLGLVNLESDLLQLQLTAGEVSLDLRSLPAGQAVELDTPNAAFIIEQPGYYRAAIVGDTAHFITRRGGRATITTADGQSRVIASSEEVVVRGTDAPRVETYVAPEPDAWDRWNYARTDHEIEALSARYVPAGVYGAGALDHYGSWRVVPTYGTVWVPQRVAPGWAPYTTGSWIWDPFYGWTWVDNSPWGWAPFHYGRWVYVNSFWAWAPGPLVARPVYAPALVAFFGLGSGVSLRVGIGGPGIAWVPLGWGEPVRPWWRHRGVHGAPSWRGWGGPRVVNNVVIHHDTVVNVDHIVYQNARVSNAVVAVDESRFGRGPVRGARRARLEPDELDHIHGAPQVKPVPASLVAETGRAVRPPRAATSRPVVATRPPREVRLPWNGEERRGRDPAPAPRIVAPAKQPDASEALPRPSFATQGPERPRPSPPRRFEDIKRSGQSPARVGDGRVAGESVPRPAAAPPAGLHVPQAVAPPGEARREARPAQEPPAAAPGGSPPAPQAAAPQRELRREEPRVPEATPPRREERRDGRAPPESRAAAPAAAPPAPQAAPVQQEMRREERPAPQSRAPAPAAPQVIPPQREERREARPVQEPRVAPSAASRPAPQAVAPQRESRREERPAAAPAAGTAAPQAAPPQREMRRERQPAREYRALPGRPANEQFPGRGGGRNPERERRDGERR